MSNAEKHAVDTDAEVEEVLAETSADYEIAKAGLARAPREPLVMTPDGSLVRKSAFDAMIQGRDYDPGLARVDQVHFD